jgi:hypothetical protein
MQSQIWTMPTFIALILLQGHLNRQNLDFSYLKSLTGYLFLLPETVKEK